MTCGGCLLRKIEGSSPAVEQPRGAMRVSVKNVGHGVIAATAACTLVVAGLTVMVPSAGAASGDLTTDTPSVSELPLTLGDIELNGVTVTNASATNDTIPAVFTASGSDAADFLGTTDQNDSGAPGCTLNVDFSLTIAPGGQCDIDAWFAPSAVGTRSATIAVPDSLNSGLTLSVSGEGTIGYYQVQADGNVSTSGDVFLSEDEVEQLPPVLNHPIVGLASTVPFGAFKGFWLVASDGGIFSYDLAQFFGSPGSIRLNKPIVGMAATPPKSQGYWEVAADGGIFNYGSAKFFGSTGNLKLNKPIVGMAATPTGAGYWLVASDGGIFSYGDAQFYGSTGSIRLNQPIVGMASTPDGRGYWLVAADGGVFAFGDASFYGSAGSLNLNQPIVGMTAMPTGHGYWLTAADGGIFNYGDAPFFSGAFAKQSSPVVGMANDGSPTLQALGFSLVDVASPLLRTHIGDHAIRADSLLAPIKD
jgi:hypothetical protein